MMFCRTCGKEINDYAVICPHCGCRTRDYEEPSYEKNKGISGAAVIGFVLSLVSLFFSFYCIVPILGIIFSGAGLSSVSHGEKSGKGLAVAGLVISIISFIYNIVILLFIGSLIELLTSLLSY